MIIVSVDGACRGNGKPNCLSTGTALFFRDGVMNPNNTHETPSSNQRGEMLGMAKALDGIIWLARNESVREVYVVMDSEFVFNTLTKDWIGNWNNKGWVTAENKPVKNQDIWKPIKEMIDELDKLGVDIIPYHVKGHLVSIGPVTAAKMLQEDPSGTKLYDAIWRKYEQDKLRKPEKWEAALELFERNNGAVPSEEVFKKFVVLNTVTDYIATTYADDLSR